MDEKDSNNVTQQLGTTSFSGGTPGRKDSFPPSLERVPPLGPFISIFQLNFSFERANFQLTSLLSAGVESTFQLPEY